MAEPKKGDKVSWKSHGGTAHGSVERKITRRTSIKGHTVDASEDDPQYVVKTDGGAEAAHKPGALKKGSGPGAQQKRSPAASSRRK